MSERDAGNKDEMTLAERLREKIKREGALTFRDWVATALYDPHEGYYCRSDLARWGRRGDYRTSPERSPLFAATFARYFSTLYEELDVPPAWTIFEAGAGAGHFAHGVLKTLQHQCPRVFAATTYVIDEASADSRKRAKKRLSSFNDIIKFRRLEQIEAPISAGLIFSNELLDAFPAHRVVMRNGKLYELCVGLSETGQFIWVEREPTTARLAAHFERAGGVRLTDGQIAEVNLDAEDWMRRAAAALQRGFIVTVDYGAEASELYDARYHREGTLRAFHQHQFAEDMLAHPGEQDLTTSVDWTQIKRVGEECGLQLVSFDRQDQFLLRAGLLEQLELMTDESQSDAESLILSSSTREMILPGGMSESFQVLVQKKQ